LAIFATPRENGERKSRGRCSEARDDQQRQAVHEVLQEGCEAQVVVAAVDAEIYRATQANQHQRHAQAVAALDAYPREQGAQQPQRQVEGDRTWQGAGDQHQGGGGANLAQAAAGHEDEQQQRERR
jgi:hypothetical protein